MSLQQLAAQHMAAQGRGPDSQLVHMSPREVAGLQALAMAHGGSLSINPETGLPEAGFLDKLLPAIIGAGLMFATGGTAGAAIIPGLSNAATIGLGVGALQTARTGDLGKGIMAGLGAYGGAGLGAGLGGSGMTVANPQAAQIAAAQAAPVAQAGSIGSIVPEAAQAVGANAAFTPSVENFVPENFLSGMSDVSAVEGAGVAGTGLPTRSSTFASRLAAMPNKDLAKYGLAAAAPVLTDSPRTKMPGEDSERFNYAFDAGRTEEGYVDPVTGQRRYFNPTYTRLAAAGGPVEEMSAANVYDMQNARGGVSDMGIDNSTGMQRMADGGITGNGELNLNIPLNFGGGGGGFLGQGPLNLGQSNNTGFGQAAPDVYRPGAGASSGPSEFFPPKPSSTFEPTQNPGQNMTGGGMLAGMGGTAANGFMSPAGGGFGQGNSPFGLNENPFNLGTQLASRLGSANQNPFAGQPTPEMMTSQREAMFNPAFDLADLQRTVGDREQSFDEFQSHRKMRRHPGDQVPTDAQIQSSYQNYLQGRNDNLAKINDLQRMGFGRPEGNMWSAPLAHVLRPGTAEYDNYAKNRGPSNQFERFAAGGMAGGGISALKALSGYGDDKARDNYTYDPTTKKYAKIVPAASPIAVAAALNALDYGGGYGGEMGGGPAGPAGPGGGGMHGGMSIGGGEAMGGFGASADVSADAASGPGGDASGAVGGGTDYGGDGFGSYAIGGLAALAGGGASHLGDYSDGGRLLRGPGDGVSDSIPAVIGRRRPARLADGEFVVPARIVSELGNGSTEAGARKLYAMMDRVQRARGKTTGKGKVAKNTRADKHLPA